MKTTNDICKEPIFYVLKFNYICRVVRTESLIDVDDPEAEDYEGGGFQGEDEDDDTIYECPGMNFFLFLVMIFR